MKCFLCACCEEGRNVIGRKCVCRLYIDGLLLKSNLCRNVGGLEICKS